MECMHCLCHFSNHNLNLRFVFVLSNDVTWVIDLRSAPGSVKKVKPTQEQTDNGVTITVEDGDFISMLTGKANAQQLVRCSPPLSLMLTCIHS